MRGGRKDPCGGSTSGAGDVGLPQRRTGVASSMKGERGVQRVDRSSTKSAGANCLSSLQFSAGRSSDSEQSAGETPLSEPDQWRRKPLGRGHGSNRGGWSLSAGAYQDGRGAGWGDTLSAIMRCASRLQRQLGGIDAGKWLLLATILRRLSNRKAAHLARHWSAEMRAWRESRDPVGITSRNFSPTTPRASPQPRWDHL